MKLDDPVFPDRPNPSGRAWATPSTPLASPLLLAALLFSLSIAPWGAGTARGQSDSAPCGDPASRQLDFWLGDWELSWEGGTGRNRITRRYDDCVIEENFEGEMPWGRLLGHSVSVYVPSLGRWRQTWVDNRGRYLVFDGGMEDTIMRLYGEERLLEDGRKQVNRMSWLNVTDDALDWHWERTLDGGRTWEMVWKIHYQRRR